METDKGGAPEGNQNAVKRSRLVSDTLRKIAVQNPEKLRAACEALINKAAEGDTSAYKELRDTLDGKPAQVIEGIGTDGAIILKITSDDTTVL